MRTIEVARIVGTVDRCCDFDRCFHPRRGDLRSRVRGVERAFPDGAFPPIDVVQVDGAYFVVDGHKRVSAARRAGVELIDANVKRLSVAYPVDAGTQPADLALLESEDRFLRETGLKRARPDARVRCLSARSYAELLEAVKAHGYDLMRAQRGLLAPAAVATHWYDCDFQPTLAAAAEAGVAELLACCPVGELYLACTRSRGTCRGATARRSTPRPARPRKSTYPPRAGA